MVARQKLTISAFTQTLPRHLHHAGTLPPIEDKWTFALDILLFTKGYYLRSHIGRGWKGAGVKLESEDGFPGGATKSFVITFDENIAAKVKARIDGNAKRLIRLRIRVGRGRIGRGRRRSHASVGGEGEEAGIL